MEGLVVSHAKQLHLITSKARSYWLLRGVDNELTQSQGQRGFILTVELYLAMDWCFSVTSVHIHDSGSIVP